MLLNLGKALRNTLAGVVWRFGVFALAVAGFSGLMGLRQWHTRYAPSEVWAQEAAGKGLDWSPMVGAAARTMLPAKETYDDEAGFKRALLKQVRNPDVRLRLTSEDERKASEYRKDLATRKDILQELREEINPRDQGFARKTALLSGVNARIADASARLEQLRKDGAKPEEIQGQEKQIKDLLEERADLRTDIKEQNLERGAVETGFQKPLAELEARIKTAEDGIDTAMDAALSSARPIQGILPPKVAIHIGDENNPLHILYVLAWYGLEGFIVLLMCLVIVPPLLRFSAGTADPKTVQSNVTKRVRDWLGQVLGPRTIVNTARVAAVAAVTGLTAMAAGDQPPVVPMVQHENEGSMEFRGAIDRGTARGPEENRGENPAADSIPPELQDVPAIAADLLRMDGAPDGVLARVSPFARYQVTHEVIGTIERATKHSDALPVRSVLGALTKVEGRTMRVWKFRRSLRIYSRADLNPDVHDLLQKLMPLILKTSRIVG